MDSVQSIFLDLNQLIPIVNHWFHLLSAVIWIGGLAFIVMAVKPGLREAALPKEYVRPITDAFYKHYKRVAGILLVVLLFTGGINLHYVNQIFVSQTGQGMQNHPKYLWIFCIKLILVCASSRCSSIPSFSSRIRTRKRKAKTTNRFPFQRAALWMGFFIILCAAAMKHLHQ
jgi:uncharacterized membrane protein